MIAINAKAAFHSPRTGLEEYTYQLLCHLIEEAKERNIQKHLLLYGPSWAHMPEEFSKVPYNIIHSPYLWTQWRLGAQLFWDQPDVFFNTEQILPYGAPPCSVVTIHDVAYEVYPDHYPAWHRRYLRYVTRRAARKAKRIIAVSERTKRDITKFYAVPQRKIEVVYHGFSKHSSPTADDTFEQISPLALPTKNPYFLAVGRLERKKNIIGLMQAFELFRTQTKKDMDLVLAGPPGFGYEEIVQYRAHSSVADAIHLMGYVSKTLKEQLYTNASACMFVSLYEGFGLPALEAQSFGLPLIASATSSLPEVVGEGGLLADPESPEDICEKMKEIERNKKIRAYVIKKGYSNLERFSWQKSAKQTLDILSRV